MKRTCFTLCALLAACGGESNQSGSLLVTTYGEDFIEQQIPAASGPDSEGFVDGYELRFSRFLIALSNVRVAENENSEPMFAFDSQRIYDLTKPGPHAVVDGKLSPQRWQDVGISLRPASGASAANASAEDIKLMNDNRYSVFIAAEAHELASGKRYTVEWGFQTETSFGSCQDAGGQLGVVIPSGGSATVQFTIHGDHFFYDSLQGDAELRFQAIADADANGDKKITLQELSTIDLTSPSLPANRYDTAGDGRVRTLADFVTALTRTLVHYQGEGHCHATKTGS
jgi:hypothetical protein